MASSAEAEDDLLMPSVPEARVSCVTQWIPHGQLLVPDTPPEADSRMANFPGLNEGGHTGYHELRRQAGAWPTTEATPDGPAGMLRTSRDLYAQSYYAYALMAVGCTWSVFAVEAALRMKLGADRKTQFSRLVKQAEQQSMLPRPGWDYEQLDAGREFRNRVVHGNQHGVLPPVVTRNIIGGAHQAVAALFPDQDSTRPQLPEA
jgi:hypothetical protein